MFVSARVFWTAAACAVVLLPNVADAEDIDTEHLFGFMIGSDVGERGEREFQSQTTGLFAKGAGRYRVGGQEFELEFVPMQNFRVEIGGAVAGHDIGGVPGLDDRRQLTWQGLSLDLRYRFLARDSAPFGMALSVDTDVSRIEESSGVPARQQGMTVTLAFDREIVPNLAVAALNLSYQPEWTRLSGAGDTEQEATLGAAFGLMAQLRPGILLGGEARYYWRYDSVGLNGLAGQALFIGPTAYIQLSKQSRLTAAWGMQAWGQSAGSAAAGLDLINFERHQGRLIFGVNF
jgi:hypothetical protein